MCRQTTHLKGENKPNGKSGYTLVEICVVLALIAILSTMIVSFSALMSGYVRSNKTQYRFLEDCAEVEENVTEWVRGADSENTVFTVDVDGSLIAVGDFEQTVNFADGVLFLGEKTVDRFESIDGIAFYASGNLIKCVMHRTDDKGKEWEHSFAFCLRCGTIEAGEATQNE